MNVCWNNVYKNVFNMNMWESVKSIECDRLYFVHTAFLVFS